MIDPVLKNTELVKSLLGAENKSGFPFWKVNFKWAVFSSNRQVLYLQKYLKTQITQRPALSGFLPPAVG